jgi:carbamoyltransferase
MTIIGIHDGHSSSCAISKNGEIIYAAQEERFTRRKNEESFPKNSLLYALNKYNIKSSEIEEVAIAGVYQEYSELYLRKDTTFKIADYYKEMLEYWEPRLAGKPYDKHYLLNLRKTDKRFQHDSEVYQFPDELKELEGIKLYEKFNEIRKNSISELLKIDATKVKFYDHHTCHIYYGYFSNPRKKSECAAFTIDSMGDNVNQVVWDVNEGNFQKISETNQCELARVYRFITLYLGMRPFEHEYKVMGLAPYAKSKYSGEVAEILNEIIKVEGIKIVHNKRPADLFKFIRDNLAIYRFDNIAAGLQEWLENNVTMLVQNIHNETGKRDFVFSGGVSMNVKLNKRIAEMECVNDLYVAGSSADESLSIGVCYLAEKKNQKVPLKNLYLGYSVSEEDLTKAKSLSQTNKRYKVTENITTEQVAKLLAKGEVVAWISGRAEFGARALGNRSVLANPSDRNVVVQINEMIKDRDFWMPFALSVLDEDASRYLVNPKNISANYMANSMDTKPEFYEQIAAGTHPYDKSVRPQIVTEESNASYHQLIKAFKKETGIGALLNTSLNLHGLPIANGFDDALLILEKSELKFLAFEGILIEKMTR